MTDNLFLDTLCTLPQLAKLQPLRLIATFGTHVVLAVHGGQCLYAVDTGSGREASALSHHTQPVCSLEFIELGSELFLVALQEDAGVAVWVWSGTKPTQRAWRPLPGGGSAPQLRLPAVPGHRGCVRAACTCAVGSDVCLLWLLQRTESSLTELLLRRLPLEGDTVCTEAPVERLGRLGDARRLFSAGGCEAWVLAGSSTALAAHRWCILTRVCLVRVCLAPGAITTLHGASRELLVRSPCGGVTALGPPLRIAPQHARTDAGTSLDSHTTRRVGSLRSSPQSGSLWADGGLLFMLQGGCVVAHHLASGIRIASAPMPRGAVVQLADGSSGGVVVWHVGDGGVSIWHCSARASSTAAVVLFRAQTEVTLAAVVCESQRWGGCLGGAEASASLRRAHHASREGGGIPVSMVPGSGAPPLIASSLAHVSFPALRSLASLLPLLHQQACQSPQDAQSWAQTRACLEALGAGASFSAGAGAVTFRCYTPLVAVSAHAWSVAAARELRYETAVHAPVDGCGGWERSGSALVAAALSQCTLEHDNTAEEAVLLYGSLLASGGALCSAALSSRCSSCAAMLIRHRRSEGSSAASLMGQLASLLARVTVREGSPGTEFEAAVVGLFSSLPSALTVFLRVAAREGCWPLCNLAQHALRILPPARDGPLACTSLPMCRRSAQAELLCMAGHHASGMWLVLHGNQPDWAAAVRLLERECGGGGGCLTRAQSLAVAPLMLEVLSAKVCEALDPSVDFLDGEAGSESLAACVAHLFIAAKSVAALVRSDAAPPQTGTWKSSEPSLLDALQGVLDACGAQQEQS